MTLLEADKIGKHTGSLSGRIEGQRCRINWMTGQRCRKEGQKRHTHTSNIKSVGFSPATHTKEPPVCCHELVFAGLWKFVPVTVACRYLRWQRFILKCEIPLREMSGPR